jgi:ABC-type phosphate transport system auxiliary subunit
MVGKRKAQNELSENPHTKKARARMAAMNEVETQIEKAKKADAAAVSYGLRKLRKSKEYLQASKEEQEKLSTDLSDTILHKR